MVRKHTPDELATAKRILKERAPHMKKMVDAVTQEKIDSSATIAMLQRRTKTLTVDLPLEGGDTIQIYSRMSEADMKTLDGFEEVRLDHVFKAEKLVEKIKNLKKTDNQDEVLTKLKKEIDKELELSTDCWLQVIAKITVDEAITFEWLKDNPDMYSSEDIIDAYLAFKEARKQQIADRVKRVESFRENVSGEGLHPVPPLVGNKGPT